MCRAILLFKIPLSEILGAASYYLGGFLKVCCSKNRFNANHPLSYNCNDMAFKPEYVNCVLQFNENPIKLNKYLLICDNFNKSFYDR